MLLLYLLLLTTPNEHFSTETVALCDGLQCEDMLLVHCNEGAYYTRNSTITCNDTTLILPAVTGAAVMPSYWTDPRE